MLSGVGNEWLPTLGVSWHVPQKPATTGMPPGTRPPADLSSLSPATPVMLMGVELNSASPRATAALGSCRGSVDHVPKRLKTAGLKGPLAGFSKAGIWE